MKLKEHGRLMKVAFALIALLAIGCQIPPAQRILEPGPGVGGPGPGVIGFPAVAPVPTVTSQIAFVGPEGMHVQWDVTAPGAFDSEPLVCPGRFDFPQGAIYRLKLSNIPGRPGVELYPTLEVAPAMPRTEAFLAHNAIPVVFTPEDFDQVLAGNFVTKVIYLPDPEFQELALAGVETLVSTRLDPGVDPIQEADRRGSILAIVRLGNKDLQMPAPIDGDVAPAQYVPGGPQPMPVPVSTGTVPINYISGVTGPEYGMPMCGTPIGLPGPPHVPLGAPASLQRHVMRNHTAMFIPRQPRAVRIHVRQDPGFWYPRPASKAYIVEKTGPLFGGGGQPLGNQFECITP
ncbi:MAG: hypothetical protein NZ899_03460 [Thermoguttaceae bacterium]|nr:hypothetical protein [Thermoguttaceae bacterium]MDW8078826.1 hypothetical protein [Thermoguttaceae bacterium]